jgi:tryptophan synthase alpha chain
MNRLDQLAARKRPILACLLQPGDPELPPRQAEICVENGADILEVSLPYAHPFLDGEVVTQSMQRALAAGMTQSRLERELCGLRESVPSVAVVLMGYRNLKLPGNRMRTECWRNVDGILKVGSRAFRRPGSPIPVARHLIHRIGFVSDHVGDEELAAAKQAGGYVMLQACSGRTGVRRGFDRSNAIRIARLRAAGVSIPILLGFGISTPAHARLAMQCGADGVIVGSACTLRALAGEAKLARFVSQLRTAIDAAR